MTVILLDRVSPGVRGHLGRWMLEIKAGVFVGKISARVRRELWEHLHQKLSARGVLMLYAAANEQGFTMEASGELAAHIHDFDGLLLVGAATFLNQGGILADL